MDLCGKLQGVPSNHLLGLQESKAVCGVHVILSDQMDEVAESAQWARQEGKACLLYTSCFEPMDKPAIARPSASVRIRYFPLQKALHLLSTSLYAFSETTSCTISNFIPPTLSESIKQKPREKPGSISYMGTLSMIVNPISLHSAIAFSISSTLTQMW